MLPAAQREREQRAQSYREKALKMYPWICAACGREFGGKKLRDLTVHHKDHDHENNPPDGSNWELLCIYCHDNEHDRQSVADAYGTLKPGARQEKTATSNPFAALGTLLQEKK
ncbi:MAG: YajD family HNH nuclease [Desulfobulbaceae bacterium]|nr:YajD family HNH nuclease [Desulfobulbaceae bacterium]